jgi:hypothetical protein
LRIDPKGLKCTCVAEQKLSDFTQNTWWGQRRIPTCIYQCTKFNGSTVRLKASHSEWYLHSSWNDDGSEGNCIGQQYSGTRYSSFKDREIYIQSGFESFDPADSPSEQLRNWAKSGCNCQ